MEPGTPLGPYQVLEPLAAGATSELYRGAHGETGAPAALKVLGPRHRQNPFLVEALEREAALLGRLEHPHLVRLLGAGRGPRGPWLALELLPGPDLAGLVARGQALPPARILELLRPLGEALAYLHAEGLVHRDLQPRNARLDAAGRARLLDLGLARPPNPAEPGLASQGTPGFSAPEQLLRRAVDARADVYSLGRLGLFLGGGESPTLAAALRALAAELPEERPASMREALARLPAGG